ncbi:MAG: hypothetical protein P8X58_12890 [Syntrophobacterales bacterium]
MPRSFLCLCLVVFLLMAFGPQVQAAGSPAGQAPITIYHAQVIKMGEARIKAEGPLAHASKWVSALSKGEKPPAVTDEAQLNKEWQNKIWTGIVLEMEFSTTKQTLVNAKTFAAKTASGKSAGSLFAMFLVNYQYPVVIQANMVPAVVKIGQEEFQCVPQDVHFSKTKTVSSNLIIPRAKKQYDGILLYRKPKTKLWLGLLFPGQPDELASIEFLGTSVKLK